MKKIALLGGTHFIGVHLLHALHSQGNEITVFNRGRTRPPLPQPEGIHSVSGDRNQPHTLKKLFKRDFDVVFDLSGFSPGHIEPIVEDYRSAIGHYVFCSTPAVYELPPPVPVTEDAPRVYLKGSYGGDKALAEELLLTQCKEHGWPVTIVRPQGVFGACDPWHAGFILYRLMHSLPITLSTGNDCRINPLYVDDLVNAFLKIISHPQSRGAIYGVAGEEAVSPIELVKLCEAISSHRADIKYIDGPGLHEGNKMILPWLNYDLIANCDSIKSDLGLKFTPLEEALDNTFRWIKNHPAVLQRYSFFGEKYLLNGCAIPFFSMLCRRVFDFAEWLGRICVRIRGLRYLEGSRR